MYHLPHAMGYTVNAIFQRGFLRQHAFRKAASGRIKRIEYTDGSPAPSSAYRSLNRQIGLELNMYHLFFRKIKD